MVSLKHLVYEQAIRLLESLFLSYCEHDSERTSLANTVH